MTDTPVQTSGFVKSVKSGRILRRTDILAARTDMVPCDVHGKVEGQHEADLSRAAVAGERVLTKFLGSTKNGVLYNYSDILAERSEMISVNTIKEWETYKKTGMAPQPAANVVAPVLGREPKPAAPVVPPAATPAPSPETLETAIAVIPDVSGLGARAAKTILSDWAEQQYQQKLDRRRPLPELIKQCEELLKPNNQAATG